MDGDERLSERAGTERDRGMNPIGQATSSILVAGAGLVTIVLNGKGAMQRLKIDPSLVKPEDAEILEDLIIAAHNDAKSKIEMRLQEETQNLMGGLPLPPGMKFPF